MKKIRNFILLCLVAIISAGCVKFNVTMDIKKDKSMDFVIVYAFDKTLMGESGSLKEENFSELKKDGYDVEKYSEGNYEGFKIIKKFKNIDDVSTDQDVEFDLSGMMENNENNKYIFKVVKDGDKNTYYAKLKFDSSNSGLTSDNDDEQTLPDEDDSILTTTEDDDSSTDNVDLSGMMGGSMDLKVSVNLPNSAISSNATTKEDNNKKLTWNLEYGKSQYIEFAFELDANAKADSNILLYACIGGGVLLVAVIVLLVVSASKKKKNATPAPKTETPKKEIIK